jgi:DNA-binding winged helix-turn-helix (wHTH) protein
MTVSEVRAMLKGIKGTEDIFISIPNGKGYTLYPQFYIEKDTKLKSYKLKINENY